MVRKFKCASPCSNKLLYLFPIASSPVFHDKDAIFTAFFYLNNVRKTDCVDNKKNYPTGMKLAALLLPLEQKQRMHHPFRLPKG